MVRCAVAVAHWAAIVCWNAMAVWSSVAATSTTISPGRDRCASLIGSTCGETMRRLRAVALPATPHPNGPRKRSLVTDTLGLRSRCWLPRRVRRIPWLAPLSWTRLPSSTPASVRSGSTAATAAPRRTCRHLGIDMEISARATGTKGFTPIPKRLAVERTHGWLALLPPRPRLRNLPVHSTGHRTTVSAALSRRGGTPRALMWPCLSGRCSTAHHVRAVSGKTR